jgi:hypothetical protein
MDRKQSRGRIQMVEEKHLRDELQLTERWQTLSMRIIIN